MTKDKIKDILDTLNTLQEELLSLADDIHLSIDPRNKDSLKQGYEFLTSYNENIDDFSEISTKLEEQIKSHFGVSPETDEIVRSDANKTERDRIIKELDKTQAHYLGENFTYKRPYGFIIDDIAIKGLKTWKNLYLNLLSTLHQSNKIKYDNLPIEEKFETNRGNRYFSTDKTLMRVPVKVDGGFYTELNLSANHICNLIKLLLDYFNIQPNELKIYLREDRDAGNKK